ncbi:hypothetical protein NMY22_g13935 [Coprinellus aureogranulatus]|nr:hypothetical protein NMY22_g13935 [Coprinellus aureogranulatus]
MPSTRSTSSSTTSTIHTSTSYSTPLSRSSQAQDVSEIYHPTKPLPPCKPNNSFTRKPEGMVSVWVWRWRMWFEATFVLSMLEPWEKIMMVCIFLVMSALCTYTVITYLPHHLTLMKRRATYYLVGQEGDERLLWQWASQVYGSYVGALTGGGHAARTEF